MTEQEFRAKFDDDRRAGRLTWVECDGNFGIALGIDSFDRKIILHGNVRIPLEDAEHTEDRTAPLAEFLAGLGRRSPGGDG